MIIKDVVHHFLLKARIPTDLDFKIEISWRGKWTWVKAMSSHIFRANILKSTRSLVAIFIVLLVYGIWHGKRNNIELFICIGIIYLQI